MSNSVDFGSSPGIGDMRGKSIVTADAGPFADGQGVNGRRAQLRAARDAAFVLSPPAFDACLADRRDQNA